MLFYHPFGEDKGITLRDYFAMQLYVPGADAAEQLKAAYLAADEAIKVREMSAEQLAPPAPAPEVPTAAAEPVPVAAEPVPVAADTATVVDTTTTDASATQP